MYSCIILCTNVVKISFKLIIIYVEITFTMGSDKSGHTLASVAIYVINASAAILARIALTFIDVTYHMIEHTSANACT